MKTGSKLGILVFSIVAIAHLPRLIGGIEVIVDSWSVPQWVSLPGIIVPGLIAALLWKESRQ
jgi:hypothetical protein